MNRQTKSRFLAPVALAVVVALAAAFVPAALAQTPADINAALKTA